MKFQAEGMVNFWTSSPVKREYSELYNGQMPDWATTTTFRSFSIHHSPVILPFDAKSAY
jgi:hypothetical protein